MAAMIVSATVALMFTACAFCLELDFHDIKYTSHPNWRLLPSDTCGKRANFSPRVISGGVAELGQYPWIAKINKGCGGSIINERYILTAAHCVDKKYRYKVRLGEHTQSSLVDCTPDMRRCAPPAVDVTVEDVVIHPGYGYVNGWPKNDIALLRLTQPIEFNDYVRPICLPTYTEEILFDNIILESAGWGMIIPNKFGSYPDKLQSVRVPMVSSWMCNLFCVDYLGPDECFSYVDDSKICAGKMSGKGVCHGDSGGPLMTSAPVPSRGRTTFLVGIVSSGQDGCGAPVPDLYTRVSSFMPWVLNNIRD